MRINKNPVEFKRFIRFGIVGIIGSVVDFGVFNLLASVLGFPAIWSSVVSFSLAVVNNYIWNRLWTFPETRNRPVAKQLTKFVLVSLVGLAIRTPLFAGMEKLLVPLAERLIPNFLTPTIVGHNIALAIAIGVVMLWNYIANRIWTFNTPRKGLEENSES